MVVNISYMTLQQLQMVVTQLVQKPPQQLPVLQLIVQDYQHKIRLKLQYKTQKFQKFVFHYP